ncbi:arsenic resistance N-acetyltransferase ArsN2 [Trinickia sp.]|uniref:arsenic resistance N-acetyltransferase ArsN2 n=1 Tax=Trinickia sp. TaxID=2571163 RepID=UPI003F823759
MNRADCAIRPATVADFEGVQALLAACGLPFSDLTAESLDGFLVAIGDDEIVGVAGLQHVGDTALLRSVAVQPGLRGSGLGSRLVDAALALAQARSIRALYLIPNDETAHGFFARRGFTGIERSSVPSAIRSLPEFTHLCPQTHPCLGRSLDTGSSPDKV